MKISNILLSISFLFISAIPNLSIASPQCLPKIGDGTVESPIQLTNNQMICEISLPHDGILYFQYHLAHDAPYGVFQLGYNDHSSARVMAKLNGIPEEGRENHDCVSMPMFKIDSKQSQSSTFSTFAKYSGCYLPSPQMGVMKAGTWWVTVDTKGTNLDGSDREITGAAVLGTVIDENIMTNPYAYIK